MKTLDQESVRRSNRSAILDMIRRREISSRIQIVKELDLSKATVTDIVSDLIEEGLVTEISRQNNGHVRTGPSKVGRRAVQLTLRKGHKYVIGVDLGTKNVGAAIANFTGGLEWSKTTSTSENRSVSQIVDQISTLINLGLSEKSIDRESVIAIGIAVPGTVSPEQGVVEHSYAFDWVDIPLREAIEEATGIRTAINNSTRTMALGELWYGVAQQTRNLFFVNVGNGIGSAIVLDGKLYDHHSEFGHVVITTDKVMCNCGNFGCLESVASGQAIERRAKSLLTDSSTADNIGESLVKLARAGDSEAAKIYQDAGRYIGRACSIIGNTLSPDKIVIGGGVSLAGDLLVESIVSEFRRHTRGDLESHTQIVLSRFGLDLGMRGAVALAISELVFS